MAKAAKSVEVEVSARDVTQYISGILEHFEVIESARGTYMQAARAEREGMQSIYEGMAAKGVPQKVAKLEVEIIRLIEKVKGKYADLEAEERKLFDKVARAHGAKEQLSLFGILPKAPKEPKARRAKAVVVPANGNGIAAEGTA